LSAYLDTSVLIPTLIAQPSTEAVFDWIGATNREMLISDFAAAEVAAALSRLVRMGRLASADAFARLADFDVWCSDEFVSRHPVGQCPARLYFCPTLRAGTASAGCLAPRDIQTLRCNCDRARSPLVAAGRRLDIAAETPTGR
jgi:hypothetical protein